MLLEIVPALSVSCFLFALHPCPQDVTLDVESLMGGW
jgi:hypothetical protein